MKQTLAGLALGVLLAVSSASHADTTVGTAEINITYIEGWSPENWDISLLSHTPQTIAVSLNTLNRDLQYWPAEDAGGDGAQAGNAHWSVLEVDVREGYRVTGVAVHALAYGELSAGELPDQPPGSADNGARLAWFVTAPGLSLPFSTQFTTFSGLQPFADATGPLDLGDTFRVSFDAAVWAQAVAATASWQHRQFGGLGFDRQRRAAGAGNASAGTGKLDHAAGRTGRAFRVATPCVGPAPRRRIIPFPGMIDRRKGALPGGSRCYTGRDGWAFPGAASRPIPPRADWRTAPLETA